jgi:hypothetical protein
MADHAVVVDRIAAILNPRTSPKTVVAYVEFLYASATADLTELAAYAKNGKNNPHRAKIDMNSRVRCGGHPGLLAQPVKDLLVTRESDFGIETISWHTLPTFRLGASGPEEATSGHGFSYTRSVTGPLSRELAWDRMTQSFKYDLDPVRLNAPSVFDGPQPSM